MYKLKQREYYAKTYDVKLCKGKLFKANNDLKAINSRLELFTDELLDTCEDQDEFTQKKDRLDRTRTIKLITVYLFY